VAVRVQVKTELLAWARDRSGLAREDLAHRFPGLASWERGEAPTLKQLEEFARVTRTAIGFLLLAEPPEDHLPIPDFRTMRNDRARRPSPDLLDTIYQCQQRQEWYRTFAELNREDPPTFVGSLTLGTDPIEAANQLRHRLGFQIEERGPTWASALGRLASQGESVGILVMTSGVVGSNTHRKLDPEEFRGFALVDRLAPVVFVNGADTKAAQIFTLAHEFAHVWLGESAVSDASLAAPSNNAAEAWCNQVAAEVLVPLGVLRSQFDQGSALPAELDRLARLFKASTLVVLRRVHDAGYLSWEAYRRAYTAELERVLAFMGDRASSGGNFYHTQPIRTSRRFTEAVIGSTLEGHTLYSDAFQMLGFKRLATFNELARRLGVP